MKIKLAIIYHIFTSIVVYKCGKKCYLPSSTKPWQRRLVLQLYWKVM